MSCEEDLLEIQPEGLEFPFEMNKQSSCCLQLTNITDEYVAFKVLATNQKNYGVRPNTGIISHGSTCDVTVTMRAQKKAPPDMQCKDKFLIQSVTTPYGATEKDITREMFIKECGKAVKEFKLRTIYVPANALVPEGFAPQASGVEDGCQGTSSLRNSMSSGDVLTELKFPFELRRQSSCSLQLTNKTDVYVAFKFKTTNPRKYCVRPNTGIVLPGTACDVTVTMQAQEEAPKDMQCEDKFLLQSFAAPKGATEKDITPEMFHEESGKVIKEFPLRAIYVPSQSPGTRIFC